MNTKEFRNIMCIAKSAQDLGDINIGHLYGYGLKTFAPVSTSPEAVAAIVRWQALQLNGAWDETEINEIREIGRRKFIIL